ncbi:hypothetical protein F5148DRAFT_1283036 [Russula earlei]|uniref:Uncharacterized protein n=1 Tax=Russula earlei TaxID=71964 RepID=A0ACC0UC90_9AGAM|nr:hypothetical protein F5148DRAFT_1283036 [Russula earlei]
MPSLRRAFSTPSVRASPYPTLPGSRSHRHHHHPHGGYHRRSSGSDVSARKVLADIDWWRVADGQREPGGEGEEDEDEEGGEERDVGGGEENSASASDPADSGAAAARAAPTPARNAIPIPGLLAADRGESADTDASASASGIESGPERPSTPVTSEGQGQLQHRLLTLGYSPQSYLFGQLASLAAGPRTPTRRTASESSASSLESTPEVLRTPIERLSFAGMGFADPGPEMPFLRMPLTSLDAVPLAVASKHVFPGQGGLNDFMYHDDLFA